MVKNAAKTGMATVRDGGELFYETRGAGRPVVLLHAGALHSGMWDRQFGLLAGEGYGVIRYDARSHGRSSASNGDFSYYEDLGEVLSHLGVARATLVGSSLGARTAIDFALAHPEAVEGLFLAAPGMSGMEFRDPYILRCQEAMFEAAGSRDAPAVVEWLLRSWVDGPHRSPDQVNPEVRERCRAVAMETLPKQAAARGEVLELGAGTRLDELGVPLVALVGALDSSDILDVVDLLVARVPEAKRVVLPGVGHLPSLEKPESFDRALLRFLGATER